MKIHYEPFPGFNKEFDFMYTDDAAMRLSSTEPEEPKLLKEIGVNHIVEGITERNGFVFCIYDPLMGQLLPEQIRVLWSHAYRVYDHCFSKSEFISKFQQIAKQEIEPGMFKK
jgi:hypothetical protein